MPAKNQLQGKSRGLLLCVCGVTQGCSNGSPWAASVTRYTCPTPHHSRYGLHIEPSGRISVDFINLYHRPDVIWFLTSLVVFWSWQWRTGRRLRRSTRLAECWAAGASAPCIPGYEWPTDHRLVPPSLMLITVFWYLFAIVLSVRWNTFIWRGHVLYFHRLLSNTSPRTGYPSGANW